MTAAKAHTSVDRVTKRLMSYVAIFAIGVTSIRVNATSDGLKDPVPDWVIVSVPLLKWFWVAFIVVNFAHTVIRFGGVLPNAILGQGWTSYLRRVALASVGGLPRFVMMDQLGGVPFSFWYGVTLVAIDLAILEGAPSLHRHRPKIWLIATAIVVPWGVPALSTVWPDPNWGKL